MESMNISLPEPRKAFVDSQISSGCHCGASEYVCELIRAEEKRKAEEQFEVSLLASLQGEESSLTCVDWQRIPQTVMAQDRTLYAPGVANHSGQPVTARGRA